MTKTQLVYSSANDNSIDGDRLVDDSVSNDKIGIDISGAKVIVKQTDPEAVWRDVTSKSSDIVSVLDFGAVNDGTGDQSTAIQNTIDFAASNNKAVYIPGGDYRILSPILLPSGLRMFGSGRSQTTIRVFTPNGGLVASGSFFSIHLSDFTLTSVNSYYPGNRLISLDGSTVGQGGTAGIILERINIQAAPAAIGVYANNLTYSSFKNLNVFGTSTAQGGFSKGIYLERAFNVDLRSCVVSSCEDSCIHIYDSSIVLLDACVAFSQAELSTSNYLIKVDSSRNICLQNSTVEAQSASSVAGEIYVLSTPGAPNISQDVKFSNVDFVGLSPAKQYSLVLGSGGTSYVYRTTVENCRSIVGSVASMRLNSHIDSSFINNVEAPGYSTTSYTPWTISNAAGATYFLENRNSISAPGPNAYTITSWNGTQNCPARLSVNRATNSGSSSVLELEVDNGSGLETILRLQTGFARPGGDGLQNLGAAAARWDTVYATTPSINTSDAREKQSVAVLDDKEMKVASKLKGLVRKFKFNSAVETKGSDARIHVGVLAQDVISVFESEGLDPMLYGIVCYDEWEEEKDEDGNTILEAGNRYGVRYEELLAFIVAAL